jgi:hypothetical protein
VASCAIIRAASSALRPVVPSPSARSRTFSPATVVLPAAGTRGRGRRPVEEGADRAGGDGLGDRRLLIVAPRPLLVLLAAVTFCCCVASGTGPRADDLAIFRARLPPAPLRVVGILCRVWGSALRGHVLS